MKIGHLSGCLDLKVSKAAVLEQARQLSAVSFPVGAIESAVGFQLLQKLLLLLRDLSGSSGPAQSGASWGWGPGPATPGAKAAEDWGAHLGCGCVLLAPSWESWKAQS